MVDPNHFNRSVDSMLHPLAEGFNRRETGGDR